MAVEFRCPDCRAKLRLAEAPPPGEEMECPKCGNVFVAPKASAEERPAKKPKPAGDDGDAPRKKKKKKKPAGDSAKPAGEGDKPKPKPGEGGAKKRRLKKKKSNPAVMVGAIIGGVVAMVLVIVVLYVILGKSAVADSMMAHMPDDTVGAKGIYLGQLQRYPVFYKNFEGAIGLQDAALRGKDSISKALGEDFVDQIDYIIHGVGGSETLVFRTKKVFDPALLDKLGGQADTVEGIKVYTVKAYNELPGEFNFSLGSVKIFAPNNRMIVVVQAKVPSDKLQKMVKGNSAEGSFASKTKGLGKRVTKGTLWAFELGTAVGADGKDTPFSLLGEGIAGNKAAPGLIPKSKGSEGGEYDPGPLQGRGTRISLGAKSLRMEVVYWCKSSDQASTDLDRWNKSKLSKGDEDTPPQWWGTYMTNAFGEKILIAQILSSLSFSASGELLLIKAEADVGKLQYKLASLGAIIK